jgi:hypothetical protein
MAQPRLSPAWASTAVGNVVAGPWREGYVLASTDIAAYLALPAAAAPAEPPDLIALLTPVAIRLPLGIRVAGELPQARAAIRVGHGVVEVPGRIWRPVRWWDPRPRLPVAGLLRHGRALLEVVLAEPASAFGRPVPEALAVAGALAAGSSEPALGVIGLGPGLTPAADDVVAGALAVLALTGRLPDAMCALINARAATHTATLSAALLAAAGRGQMIPQAARLLTVLATGAPIANVRAAAADLFRIGSTSGHALCAGMAGTLASAA